jgi:hypothetical protein
MKSTSNIRPETIEQYDESHSLYRINITEEVTEDGIVYNWDEYLIEHPVTRAKVIDAVVKEHYPDGASEAAIRKGVINKDDPDFVAFYNFVESVKDVIRFN